MDCDERHASGAPLAERCRSRRMERMGAASRARLLRVPLVAWRVVRRVGCSAGEGVAAGARARPAGLAALVPGVAAPLWRMCAAARVLPHALGMSVTFTPLSGAKVTLILTGTATCGETLALCARTVQDHTRTTRNRSLPLDAHGGRDVPPARGERNARSRPTPVGPTRRPRSAARSGRSRASCGPAHHRRRGARPARAAARLPRRAR